MFHCSLSTKRYSTKNTEILCVARDFGVFSKETLYTCVSLDSLNYGEYFRIMHLLMIGLCTDPRLNHGQLLRFTSHSEFAFSSVGGFYDNHKNRNIHFSNTNDSLHISSIVRVSDFGINRAPVYCFPCLWSVRYLQFPIS